MAAKAGGFEKELLFNEHGLPVWEDENIWRWMVLMVAQSEFSTELVISGRTLCKVSNCLPTILCTQIIQTNIEYKL